jgi:hypothetical protein
VAKRRVGVDHGQLRADLHVEFLPPPRFPGVQVGSRLRHARIHHDGAKVAVIRPRRAKALRFTPKGGGRPIFRRWARAAKGNPYLKDSLPLARD